MSEKTQNQSVWCDNGQQPIQMIYSRDDMWGNASIYICSLCSAEKIVKESPLNGDVSVEWKNKPKYPKTPSNNSWW
jgi:hypothetical protein